MGLGDSVLKDFNSEVGLETFSLRSSMQLDLRFWYGDGWVRGLYITDEPSISLLCLTRLDEAIKLSDTKAALSVCFATRWAAVEASRTYFYFRGNEATNVNCIHNICKFESCIYATHSPHSTARLADSVCVCVRFWNELVIKICCKSDALFLRFENVTGWRQFNTSIPERKRGKIQI